MPQGQPMNGEIYRHFKNKMYQIVAIATHSETREPLVIYQALYGDYSVYARPYEMFISEVDHVKYPDVPERYRFTLVDKNTLAPACPAQEAEAVRRVDTVSVVPSSRNVETDVDRRPKVAREQPASQEADGEDLSGGSPDLLNFLDTDSFAEKYKIVDAAQRELDDTIIDSMAASIDLVIPDGPLDQRIEHLLYAIRKRMEFDNDRIRSK